MIYLGYYFGAPTLFEVHQMQEVMESCDSYGMQIASESEAATMNLCMIVQTGVLLV